MTQDVRAIANFVLDEGDIRGVGISNASVNKLVYFLYAHYLSRFKTQLVSAKIEAWDYGPVFRELYREFKEFGDKPITKRANRIDATTGESVVCMYNFPQEEVAFLRRVLDDYIKLSAGALIALSHEPGGPWDRVWHHEGDINPTMRITDDLIRDWYRNAARH